MTIAAFKCNDRFAAAVELTCMGKNVEGAEKIRTRDDRGSPLSFPNGFGLETQQEVGRKIIDSIK